MVVRELTGPLMGRPLRSPIGLTRDSRGFIYIVDAGNHRLLKLDSALNPIREQGGLGRAPGQLEGPRYITNDGLQLLVAEATGQRIARFDLELHALEELSFFDETDPLKFGTPSGLAVLPYGELWIADQSRNRIAVFDNVGKFSRFVGDIGDSGGQLSSPEKLLLLDGERILVCDPGNRRLLAYDLFGTLSESITDPDLGTPVSVAVDSGGLHWVVDTQYDEVVLFSADWKRLSQFGPGLPGTNRELADPSDILILSPDRLLIADTGNDRVLECRLIRAED